MAKASEVTVSTLDYDRMETQLRGHRSLPVEIVSAPIALGFDLHCHKTRLRSPPAHMIKGSGDVVSSK